MAATTALAFGATACSGGGAPAGGGSNDGVLTMAVEGPTYPKNFNRYTGSDKGTVPGLNLVYESPFELDPRSPGKLIPKLAEGYEMENEGRTLVLKVRKGVKWSDGKELTAEDFAFTYGFVNGDVCDDPLKCLATKLPEVVDTHTVKIHFTEPKYHQVTNYSMWYPIYPAHIWKDRERKTDINENPVGTGPFTVKDFTPQQVTYKIRDDYWGGKSKGVKEVKYVPMGPIGGVQAQLGRGQLDVVEGKAPGVIKDFVEVDPKQNHYSVYSGGGSLIITFNTTVKPLDDAHVRRALRSALDLKAAADLSGIGFGVPSVTGLDPRVYKDTLSDDYRKAQTQNVEAAKKELAAGGWTITDGNLTKDGQSYPLDLRVDNADPTWMQLGQVYTDQWNKTLGLKVGWQPTPTQVFNKESHEGNYAMFASGAVPSGTYWQAYGQYSKANWRAIGDKDIPGNYGRWQNEIVHQAITELSVVQPDDIEKTKPIVGKIHKAIDEDAPFIAAIPNTVNLMWSSRKWTGLPDPADPAYIPSPKELNTSVDTVMNLKPVGK